MNARVHWLLVAILAWVGWVATDALADTTRLSGSMQPLGNIKQSGAKITPDGTKAVFLADAETDLVDELYVTPVDGGARVKISHPVALGPVVSFQIAPDSSRAVFLVQTAPNPNPKYELYAATLNASALYNLSGTIVAGGYGVINNYQISADGLRVVFMGHKESITQDELFSVSIFGGAVTKVSGPVVAGGNVQQDFLVTPDSTRVVFRANKDTVSKIEVYSVGISQTTPIKLNSSMIGDAFSGMAIAPNSSRVVYFATQDNATVTELYSAQVSVAGSSTKISASLVAGGNVQQGFVISPDSSTVVYRADRATDEVFELLSTPIAGGTNVNLSGTLVAGGNVVFQSGKSWWVVTPDSTRVVFLADKDVDQMFELYMVPLTGGLPTKISGSMIADGDVLDFQMTPNGSRVVFRADREVDQRFELYSVPVTGGTVVKVSGPLVANGNVSPTFSVTPDSARVVFIADKDTDGVDELFYGLLTGAAGAKLSGKLVSGGMVLSYVVAPGGNNVVFIADKDIDNTLELYSSGVAGSLAMDIDGNGVVDALTDGLLLIRWQFGLRGPALILNAIGPNASRNTDLLIEAYLTKLDTHSAPN